MVSAKTIIATGVLNTLGISFFVDQPKDRCSAAPPVGKYIFLLAILLLFWDSDMIPRKLKPFSPRIFACGDLLFTIFFTELILLVGCILGAVGSLCIVLEVLAPRKMKNLVGQNSGGLLIPQDAGPVFKCIHDVQTFVWGAIYFSQLTREERILSVHAFEAQLRYKKGQDGQPGEPAVQVSGNQMDAGKSAPEPEIVQELSP
ncbi:GD23584 [Drosophila simulans]|uniref:GD23584 n=1 Tax=Drosophila simulans TaxID=7240 RepID=B4Q7P4_DROSI|nr:GD23584 [Drosophila simulans]